MPSPSVIAAAEGLLEGLRDRPDAFTLKALPGVASLALQVIDELRHERDDALRKSRGAVQDTSKMEAAQRARRKREARAKSSRKQS